MRLTSRTLFGVCCLLALVSALSNDPVAADQPPPRLAFVGPDSITMTPGGAAASIQLQNNTAETLTVDVSVIDFEPKSPNPVSAAINFAPRTLSLKPAGSEMITINPPVASVDQKYPDFGKGYLLAIEHGKQDFDRRVIQINKPEPTPAQSARPIAPADFLQSINMSGINFAPSLISPLLPALSVFILFLLIWAAATRLLKPVQRETETPERGARRVILVILCLFIILTILGVIWSGKYWDLWQPSQVVIQPVLLNAPKGVIGGVSSNSGSMGQLESDGSQLSATGIKRAGTYEGNLKLPVKGKDEREVKVALNVSDWWPYAFLTIAAGVLLGYYLTQYFKQRREEDKQRLRGAQFWRRVVDGESRFQAEHGGQPFAGYQIVDISRKWLDLSNQSLAAHDAAGAKTQLDGLETYLKLFEQFRVQVVTLDGLQARVWDRIRQLKIFLSRGNIKALQQADEALQGSPFNFPPDGDEDAAGTKLKDAQTRVQALVGWVNAVEDLLNLIVGYLDSVDRIKTTGWSEANLKKLKEQRELIRDALRPALLAEKKDDLATYSTQASNAYNAILKLKDTSGKMIFNLLADHPGHSKAIVMHTSAMRTFALNTMWSEDMDAWKLPAQDITVSRLEYETRTMEGEPANTDTLFIFTAHLSLPRQIIDECKLQWDLGDGTISNIQIPSLPTGDDVALTTSHRYGKGGRYEVSLKKSTGEILKTAKIKVSQGPTRLERLFASIQMNEWQMSLISGLLAIGLGFYTLYLMKSVWGTPGDYLYALLWGSVVSEGIKYAANLVARIGNA